MIVSREKKIFRTAVHNRTEKIIQIAKFFSEFSPLQNAAYSWSPKISGHEQCTTFFSIEDDCILKFHTTF